MRSSVPFWKRNTFSGRREKPTVPLPPSTRSSGRMMARRVALWQAGWVHTMLVSRPSTSTRCRPQVRGPWAWGTNPSGRMPTHTSPSAAPGVSSTACPERHSRPAFTVPSNTLMGGVPRNFATNKLWGSSYTSWGAPCCISTPSFITTIRSEMLMASSWSWVTNKVVIPVFF